MSYTVRINGVKHTVTDGVYDPPLSHGMQDLFTARMSDMLKHGRPPGVKSDTAFHANRGSLLKQMDGDEVYTNYLVKEARKQGYNPGSDDVYIGQVAECVGDKEAWFKQGEGEAQVKRVLKRKAERRAKAAANRQAPKLSNRLTNEMMRNYRSQNLVDKSMPNSELRKLVVETHGAK